MAVRAHSLAYAEIMGQILGAFAKLQKATIISLMYVHPSARKNTATTRRIFIKFDI
jgi:hypothetical protein